MDSAGNLLLPPGFEDEVKAPTWIQSNIYKCKNVLFIRLQLIFVDDMQPDYVHVLFIWKKKSYNLLRHLSFWIFKTIFLFRQLAKISSFIFSMIFSRLFWIHVDSTYFHFIIMFIDRKFLLLRPIVSISIQSIAISDLCALNCSHGFSDVHFTFWSISTLIRSIAQGTVLIKSCAPIKSCGIFASCVSKSIKIVLWLVAFPGCTLWRNHSLKRFPRLHFNHSFVQ